MSPRSCLARCPAKVNLSLRVLGRRRDGYHELDTVFQAIDLWDELRGDAAETLTLACDDAAVPTGPDNLVLRAAEALRKAHGRPGMGASLHLTKAIPVQGGLGGGSSDAAGSLLLCRDLWSLAVDTDELARIGGTIGADVPFFLTGGTARGTGRGDRIERLPYLGEIPLVVGIPPFGVSTAEVFRRASDRLTLPANGVSVGPLSAHKSNKGKDFDAINDLEGTVFESWPELSSFRDALVGAGASRALLSGSGSCVYGRFATPEVADGAGAQLAEEYPDWSVRRTRTIDCAAHLVGGSGPAPAETHREG